MDTKIGFWKTQTGNYRTHSEGLTTEQISFLRSLNLGDKLILFHNELPEGSNRPNFAMTKSVAFKTPEQKEQ